MNLNGYPVRGRLAVSCDDQIADQCVAEPHGHHGGVLRHVQTLFLIRSSTGFECINLCRHGKIPQDLVDDPVALVQQHPSAGQLGIDLPDGSVHGTDAAICPDQRDVLDPALCDQLVCRCVARFEAGWVRHRKAYLLTFGHLHVLAGLLEGPRRRGQLQDVEFPAEGCFQLLGARVCLSGDEEAIELVLHDQLPVVAVGLAVKLRGGPLRPLRIQIGHGFDLKTPARRGCPEQAQAMVVQTQNGRR